MILSVPGVISGERKQRQLGRVTPADDIRIYIYILFYVHIYKCTAVIIIACYVYYKG